MTVKFQLRGTSLDAWYAAGFKAHASMAATPAVLASSDTGVFGSSVLNFVAHNPLFFSAGENWANGSAAWSMLFRLVPRFTGAPGTIQELIQISPGGGSGVVSSGGVSISISSTGIMTLLIRNQDMTIVYNTTLGTALTFASANAQDIWIVCKGTTASDSLQIWTAAAGVQATLLAQAPLTGASDLKSGRMAASMSLASTLYGGASNYHLNEFVIWDTAEVPSSYGVRTGFVTTTATSIEGGAQSNPGIANVRLGTAYIASGVSLVGTAAIPAATDVRADVDVDATVGLIAIPAVTDVRADVAVDWNDMGTAFIPSPDDVRAGVDVDATVGTVVVPSAADVRFGVAVDEPGAALVGLLDLPIEADVLAGVDYDDATKTGTLVLVTNYFQDKKLIARSADDVNTKSLTVSQGDQLLLSFTAMSDKTVEMDLTDAALETYIKGASGMVTVLDADHTIDPDQVANPGKFTMLMSSANSLLLDLIAAKDIVTKVTQGSFITHLHGTDVLNVLDNVPLD